MGKAPASLHQEPVGPSGQELSQAEEEPRHASLHVPATRHTGLMGLLSRISFRGKSLIC